MHVQFHELLGPPTPALRPPAPPSDSNEGSTANNMHRAAGDVVVDERRSLLTHGYVQLRLVAGSEVYTPGQVELSPRYGSKASA